MTQPPAWLEALVELVAKAIEGHDTMGPFGYRYRQEDDQGWAILLYPTPIELLDAAEEERTLASPGFSLDIHQLQGVFEDVHELYWNAHGFDPRGLDGPSILIEGSYENHNVYLEVLAYAPEDEPPGMQVDMQQPDQKDIH